MTYSRVAVFGASGQIGRALTTLLKEKALPITRKEADFSNLANLRNVLDALQPDAVINASAYTQVDKAESEEALANRVNADAPGMLAQWCAEKGIPFVHYSTDYVFDGSGVTPWQEADETGPLNAYGRGKLDGERQVQASGGNYLIFRTSWVYDAEGQNFLNTMLRLGAEREALRIVADQHGAPSYAPHLAEATLACLECAAAASVFPSGIYHMCNLGETTWHGFAQEIFDTAREKGQTLAVRQVDGITSADYPTPAKRPHNSRLNTEKLRNVFNVTLPEWQEGVNAAMEKKYASHFMPA